ncbi:hypothetical protein DL98DRAFT_623639 [Cadophora sp. DSE1049]|nr:hypothetical protein DL98DRAFT_623639 [Cadophora sp. DSE1049]
MPKSVSGQFMLRRICLAPLLRKVPHSPRIEDLYGTNQAGFNEQQHYSFFIDPRLLDIRYVPSPEPQQGSNSQEEALPLHSQLRDFPEVPNSLPQSPLEAPLQNDSPSYDLQSPPEDENSPHGPDVPQLTCKYCHRSFSKPHQLNRHLKSHERPFKCLLPGCPSRGFQYRKDLTRHVQEQHPEQSQGSAREFFCPHKWCKYSQETGKKRFARADQLARHMKTHSKGSG